MRLDTAYFVETIKNHFLITIHFQNCCSHAYLHCSCSMNSARGAELRKKKKKKTKTQTQQT